MSSVTAKDVSISAQSYIRVLESVRRSIVDFGLIWCLPFSIPVLLRDSSDLFFESLLSKSSLCHN